MNYFSTFLKGMAMGAADVVPGVSGGTIAFITGIYDTLLESIRRINPRLFTMWKQDGISSVFNYINGFFLIALFGGVFTSILSLAKLISWLLSAHPIPTWSFFFGLIIISVIHILKQLQRHSIATSLLLLLGVISAYSITIIHPIQMEANYLTMVLAGSIAICAMILPGISGSFILLLIGMYEPILNAVKTLQLDIIGLFLIGCVSGLLLFSHLLSWLLAHFKDLTFAFLTGLMIGTLPKIWPWKETLSWRLNSHGESVPLLQNNISPMAFESLTQQPSQWIFAMVMMFIAILLVVILEKNGQHQKSVDE